MNSVICKVCGQLSIILKPGEPCLRKFADGTQTCAGLMEMARISPAKRQRLNREQRKAKGICRQCSQPLAPTSVAFCKEHLEEHRIKTRQKYVRKNN